jgi:hypothetical protein
MNQTGYTLGINIGKVVKTFPRKGVVRLWWLWGTSWSNSWIEWKDKETKKSYQDDVHVDSLLQTGDGMIAKVFMKPKGHEKYILSKDSIRVIEDVFDIN